MLPPPRVTTITSALCVELKKFTAAAISAGVDMLLCPATPDKTINAIIKAVENGNLSEERIDESVLRILAFKVNRGLIES